MVLNRGLITIDFKKFLWRTKIGLNYLATLNNRKCHRRLKTSQAGIENFEDDVLEVLPLRKYALVLKLLEEEWPLHFHLHSWVSNTKKLKEECPTMALDICFPKGNLSSGIFIGISNFAFQQITIIRIKSNSVDLLAKMFLKTRRIKWKEPFQINGLPKTFHPTVYPVFQLIQSVNNLSSFIYMPCTVYVKSVQDCLKDDIKVPDNFYLSKVNEKEAEFIHQKWPHRSVKYPEFSLSYIKSFIKLNPSLGLYSKNDNKLCSWILMNDFGALSMCVTLSEYQRKGLATILINTLSKIVAQNHGRFAMSFVVDGNESSHAMVQKCNFRAIHTSVSWMEPSATQIVCVSPETQYNYDVNFKL